MAALPQLQGSQTLTRGALGILRSQPTIIIWAVVDDLCFSGSNESLWKGRVAAEDANARGRSWVTARITPTLELLVNKSHDATELGDLLSLVGFQHRVQHSLISWRVLLKLSQ